MTEKPNCLHFSAKVECCAIYFFIWFKLFCIGWRKIDDKEALPSVMSISAAVQNPFWKSRGGGSDPLSRRPWVKLHSHVFTMIGKSILLTGLQSIHLHERQTYLSGAWLSSLNNTEPHNRELRPAKFHFKSLYYRRTRYPLVCQLCSVAKSVTWVH